MSNINPRSARWLRICWQVALEDLKVETARVAFARAVERRAYAALATAVEREAAARKRRRRRALAQGAG